METSKTTMSKTTIALIGLALIAVLSIVFAARPAADTSAIATPTAASSQVLHTEQVELVAYSPARTGNTAAKTRAFATCIFGVGVPIGLAWGIATNPAAWAWVTGRGAYPASIGGAASKYMNTIKRNCAYALR